MSSSEKALPVKMDDPIMAGAMSADGVVAQQRLVLDVMRKVMKKGVHYGVIPGCDKPSLWKPGAEVLCLTFRLAPVFESVETYDGKHLGIKSRCILNHIPSSKAFGSGQAICTTKEKKYRLRKDGGRIVENANLEDSYNTVLKMADKRSLVAAILVTTAASEVFTQDMGEDEEKEEPQLEPKKEPDLTWTGKVLKVNHLKLDSGGDAWSLDVDGDKSKPFKTTEKAFAEIAREFVASGDPVTIEYSLNKNKTQVIESIYSKEKINAA